MSERKPSAQQFDFENDVLGALMDAGCRLDICTVQALRDALRERHTLERFGNAGKSNTTAARRNDQPWGCVIGLLKSATGSTARKLGVA